MENTLSISYLNNGNNINNDLNTSHRELGKLYYLLTQNPQNNLEILNNYQFYNKIKHSEIKQIKVINHLNKVLFMTTDELTQLNKIASQNIQNTCLKYMIKKMMLQMKKKMSNIIVNVVQINTITNTN